MPYKFTQPIKKKYADNQVYVFVLHGNLIMSRWRQPFDFYVSSVDESVARQAENNARLTQYWRGC